MQTHVNLVDLVKSFPTNIFFQNLASIQKRTSPLKFANLAEKSESGSISNLSTKRRTGAQGALGKVAAGRRRGWRGARASPSAVAEGTVQKTKIRPPGEDRKETETNIKFL